MITDKASLIESISSYSHRSDLASDIDTFIRAAESRINRYLRCKEMEKRITTSISSSYYTLPGDFIKFTSVQIGDRVPVNLSTDIQQDRDRFGKEITLSIQNGEVEIRPTINSQFDFEYSYFAKVTPLVAPTDTTSVLTTFPMIYLYAAMIDVALFTQDDNRVSVWRDAFTEEVELANIDAIHAKYSGSPLSVRGN